MKMLYQIDIGTPTPEMSGWGFIIKLWPGWKEAVARYDLDQHKVNCALERMGRGWLDACGYNSIFDIDNCGFDMDETAKPGPNAHPMHQPNRDLRVSWGEWGPEHITVPGNACGLDITESGTCAPRDGRALTPHNVDCMRQAYLLQMTFSWFASAITLNEQIKERD